MYYENWMTSICQMLENYQLCLYIIEELLTYTRISIFLRYIYRRLSSIFRRQPFWNLWKNPQWENRLAKVHWQLGKGAVLTKDGWGWRWWWVSENLLNMCVALDWVSFDACSCNPRQRHREWVGLDGKEAKSEEILGKPPTPLESKGLAMELLNDKKQKEIRKKACPMGIALRPDQWRLMIQQDWKSAQRGVR